MEIFKVFHFDAAHCLPDVGSEHKCSRMHGHSFRVEIHVSGAVDPRFGWVMDFADIVQAFQPLREKLEHQCLNEIDGLENPTSENIAKWIWRRLHPRLPQLCKIIVQESEESGCIYCGED
jgi:6-pyruvoyltetrahydropterin/6-carboxytetrahydropterin synthase